MPFFDQVQFVLIFTHQLQVLFRPSCQYPRVFVYWIAMHGFLFLFLFTDFYKARYNKAEKRSKKNNGFCMVSCLWSVFEAVSLVRSTSNFDPKFVGSSPERTNTRRARTCNFFVTKPELSFFSFYVPSSWQHDWKNLDIYNCGFFTIVSHL